MHGVNAMPIAVLLARREIEARYRGALLGLLWPLVAPFVLLAVYWLFFGVILGLDRSAPIRSGFVLHLFSGYVVWDLFARLAGEGPELLGAQRTLLTRVRVPLETVFLSRLLYHLAHQAASLLVLLVVVVASGRGVSAAVLWLPLLLAGLCAFSLAATMLAALVGLVLRDAREVVALVLVAWLFATPVFYDLDGLGPGLGAGTTAGALLRLNPMYWFTALFRDCLFAGPGPAPLALCALVAASLVLFLAVRGLLRRRRGLILDLL